MTVQFAVLVAPYASHRGAAYCRVAAALPAVPVSPPSTGTDLSPDLFASITGLRTPHLASDPFRYASEAIMRNTLLFSVLALCLPVSVFAADGEVDTPFSSAQDTEKKRAGQDHFAGTGHCDGDAHQGRCNGLSGCRHGAVARGDRARTSVEHDRLAQSGAGLQSRLRHRPQLHPARSPEPVPESQGGKAQRQRNRRQLPPGAVERRAGLFAPGRTRR